MWRTRQLKPSAIFKPEGEMQPLGTPVSAHGTTAPRHRWTSQKFASLKIICEANKWQSQGYWPLFFCNGWTERVSVNMPIPWLGKAYLCLRQLFFLSNLYSVSFFYDSVRNLCLTMCYLQTQISNMHRRKLSCLFVWVWNLVSRTNWGWLRGVSCERMDLKMREVTGYWRELQNEKLHKQYCSADIVITFRPRMMNCEAHVEHIGRWISIVHKIFIGKTERKRLLEDLSVDANAI